jgi:4-amino-4-deoxychorismate lyase
MHVRAGRPLNWRWHRARLEADCRALRLALPDESLLLREIAAVAPADAVVKLTLTRGASTRGYAIPETSQPTRIVAPFPAPAYPAANAQEGVAVRRCELVLSEQPRLAGAKTLNRLENVLARSEWLDPAIAEGLLGDAAGRVIEGTMGNLFIARGGRLATPRLDRCGVVGAQRERVRELAGRAGIACEEGEIRWEELAGADEMFLTNSLIGVWPVARMGERRWAPGPVTRRVQAMIAEDDARA